jgi:hypothetical protein
MDHVEGMRRWRIAGLVILVVIVVLVGRAMKSEGKAEDRWQSPL